MNLLFTIKTLYAINGIVALILYVPQILNVWKNRDSTASVSLVTFGGWTIGSFITTCYACLLVKDQLFMAVSLGNVIGSGTVFCLVASRRLMSRQTVAKRSKPDHDIQRQATKRTALRVSPNSSDNDPRTYAISSPVLSLPSENRTEQWAS